MNNIEFARENKTMLLEIFKTLKRQAIKSKKQNYYWIGLCSGFHSQVIDRVASFSARTNFLNWFNSQRPTEELHPKHFCEGMDLSGFWWPMGDYQVRLKFLNHLITQIKKL